MKKISVFLAIAFALFIFTGCGNQNDVSDELAALKSENEKLKSELENKDNVINTDSEVEIASDSNTEKQTSKQPSIKVGIKIIGLNNDILCDIPDMEISEDEPTVLSATKKAGELKNLTIIDDMDLYINQIGNYSRTVSSSVYFWNVFVNGTDDIGAPGTTTLKDGDKVEWQWTAFNELQTAVNIGLIDKWFTPSDIHNNKYSEEINFTYKYTNTTDKEIRAFDCITTFQTILGNDIISLRLENLDEIPPNSSIESEMYLDYNQFKSEHVTFNSIEAKDIIIKAEFIKIIFSDGTILE